jgi:hypothetical protein
MRLGLPVICLDHALRSALHHAMQKPHLVVGDTAAEIEL